MPKSKSQHPEDARKAMALDAFEAFDVLKHVLPRVRFVMVKALDSGHPDDARQARVAKDAIEKASAILRSLAAR